MSNSGAGIAMLCGFVVSQAIRDVYLGHLFAHYGLFEVALIAFGTAAVVFGLGLLLFNRDQIRLLRVSWRALVAVNITTLLAWMSYFGALRLVEPAAVNLAFSGIAPLAVAVLGLLGLASADRTHTGRLELLLHWALFGTIALLAVIVSTGRSGFANVDPLVGLVGVALAAFAGVAITAETIISKRMNQVGISALSIVSVRFSLVTALAAVMVARSPAAYAGLSGEAIATQSLVFLAILVGPIYLAQAGLKLTTPLLSSVISAIGPVTTLALQSTTGAVRLAPAMLGTTVLYATVSIMAAVLASTRFNSRAQPCATVLRSS